MDGGVQTLLQLLVVYVPFGSETQEPEELQAYRKALVLVLVLVVFVLVVLVLEVVLVLVLVTVQAPPQFEDVEVP